MSIIVRIGVVGALAVGPLLSVAHAQGNYYNRDKYVAVTERPQPDFDPDVIRLGSFVVNANAQVGVTQNSNVLADADDEISDTLLRFGGQINANTDWSNHQIGASVSAFRTEYQDNDNESYDDLNAALRGRLDVTQDFDIGVTAFTQSTSEARGDFANAGGPDRPIEFGRDGASVQLNYRADRFRWGATIEAAEVDYEDAQFANGGGEFDQDFRDRKEVNARTRLSYAVSPDFAVFGQARNNTREYDTPQVIGGETVIRDSEVTAFEAGVDFELQALVRGDIAVGHFTESRDDPNAVETDGLSVDARLQWFPSQLTTVEFTGSRAVRDLGLVESGSATQTRLGARVDHELLRNIIVSAFVDVQDNDYSGIARTDDITQFGISGRYKLNRNVHAEAFIRRRERDSSGADLIGDPDFTIDLIGIGFTIYP